MPQKQATLIFNPHAGIAGDSAVLSRFQAFWRPLGWDVTICPTTHAGHATHLARDAADRGADIVFAAGGDGTINEVANGLVHSETIMAIVPTGTANVFAKELSIPMRSFSRPDWLLEISDLLVHGRVQRVDVGRTGDDRHWLLWASAGLDGTIIEQIEPRSRLFKRLGMAGYAAKFAINLPLVRPMEADVWVDDRHVDGEFLMVNISNCRLYAGGEVELNTGGVLDDGLFEVWAFRGRGLWNAAQHSLMVGLKMQEFNTKVDLLVGKEVRIESKPPMSYHLDAEPSGKTPLVCSMQKQALRVLVPMAAPDDLFQTDGQALL